MTEAAESPERAKGEVRPERGSWVTPILDRAPQLTKSFRAYRAFAMVAFALTVVAIVIRPEQALVIGVICLAVLALGLLAARLNLLD